MTSRLRLSVFAVLVIAAGRLVYPCRVSATTDSPQSSWLFRTDFSRGIPEWMSYPLAQDVGYDPSTYTAGSQGGPVLIRDVIARGQRQLRVGLIRPLVFEALPSLSIEIGYSLRMCGTVTRARLTLAASDGHRYTHRLREAAGSSFVHLTGTDLGIPLEGAEIEAVLIEADVQAPLAGSHNRLTLRSLRVTAERPLQVKIIAPSLVRTAGNDVGIVIQAVTAADPFVLELAPGDSARIELDDGQGREVKVLHTAAAHGSNRRLVVLRPRPGTAPGLWTGRIFSGPAHSELRFLVLGKIPPHPRILLNSQRLAQLQSQPGSAELVRVVRASATASRSRIAFNSAAGLNILQLSPVSVFPGLVQYFALMEDYSHAIAFDALDYRLTGDGQALSAARRALDAVAAWPTWTPPWFSAHGLHTYYEVGVFTQRIALGYDLIANDLAPQERSRIAEAIWNNSIEPTIAEYFLDDRMPIAASNHMANSVGGAIAACVALEGVTPGWDARLGLALAELISADERLMTGLFPGDGSEAEPAGYEDFAMEGMSWGAAALRSLGITVRGEQRMMNSFWWLRYAGFKPGRFLDTGDFDGDLAALSGYAWPAEVSGNSALNAFYNSAPEETLRDISRQPGPTVEQAPGLLDLACCTRLPAAIALPPLSRIFPLRGSAVMRSGWNSGDTVISLRVGPWWNHEHHDEGSFLVAACGEEIIAEAGYTNYYQDPNYGTYFSQAPGHNTLIIDHDPFSQGGYDGRYWKAFEGYPKITAHLFSRSIDYIAANLAPAYDDGFVLHRFERDYLFLKPDVLIVHDRVRSAAAHQYTWLLHAPPGDAVSVAGPTAQIRGKTVLASITAGGRITSWLVIPGVIPETDYINLDRDAIKPRRVLELNSPRLTGADFLVVMRFESPGTRPLPLASVRSPASEGFRSSDGRSEILFRREPGPLAAGAWRTDGQVLVRLIGRSGSVVFVGDGRSLSHGAAEVISASEPADFVFYKYPSFAELDVNCRKPCNITLVPARRMARATLDGKPVATPPPGQPLSLASLPEGGHIVRVEY